MNIRTLVGIVSASFVVGAWAAEGHSIKILTPADGATLSAQEPNTLSYEINSHHGHHAHILVDGKLHANLHHMKGSHTFKGLTPGSHKICISMAHKSHASTGEEQCIQVTVE
jgi:hypothetical protein